MSADFYSALEDMRKTFSVGIDRVSDKLDEVRRDMATHREVDEIKTRISRTEAIIEMVRDEAAKRSEVQTILADVKAKLEREIDVLKEQNKTLQETVNSLQISQGRLPSWIWSSAIYIVMTIISWLYFHAH